MNFNPNLESFSPISLSEMDEVKLMNRHDTKYIFNINTLSTILNSLIENYSVLTISDTQINTYHTRYFDTPDKSLFLKHQNGKLNRYKIRIRTYIESNLCYLEVKFKNNKDKTIKERIKTKDEFTFSEKSINFIKYHSTVDPNQLVSSLDIEFSRMTFVNKHEKERLTIDINLSFSNTNTEKKYPNLVVAELKQEKFNSSSYFVKLMKELRIPKGNFSKYSVGSVLMNDSLKYNNFKPILLTINKITNDTRG